MSTTMTATIPDPERTSTEPAPASKAPKGSKSYAVILNGADGATLKITATRKKDGTAAMRAIHSTKAAGGQRQNQRGATEQHLSLERAKAAVEKLAGEAAKRGWTRKERRAGFVAKPDAFTAANLPSAGTESKASKKK